LEELVFGRKKAPKARLMAMPKRTARSTWRVMSIKQRRKKLISKKLSMIGNRKLINDTNRTRSVWDPKGYAEQKYYDNVYKTL